MASTPSLYFGNGKVTLLPSLLKDNRTVMLVTGASSFSASPQGKEVTAQLEAGFKLQHVIIDREPSPEMIDRAVANSSQGLPDVVVAIGGGSVVDAGKAISAMLTIREPVKNYLEGVGINPAHPGTKIPFIAIPTTSGTGSEATKNAVLSEVGPTGYKKSLRHNNFVPNIALVDPELTLGCPARITGTSGMDAFTQLLESYLSTSANSITDALALEGLRRIASSLLKVCKQGDDLEARSDMAFAAYLSGVTLANAGLGLVHGFASSIGGLLNIPHGVICSALMPSANRTTVLKLRRLKNEAALARYAAVGKLFSREEKKTDEYYVDFLLTAVAGLAHEINIPSLREYGFTTQHHKKIIDTTDNKNNPVVLDPDEMLEVLENAL